MKLLLDTNTFIWLVNYDDPRLGIQTQQLLQAAGTVYVSAITIVEIQIKSMLAKLGTSGDPLGDAVASGCALLSFSAQAGMALADFPELARHDPFARMLLAQAKTAGLTLLTADELLLSLDLPFVCDARL